MSAPATVSGSPRSFYEQPAHEGLDGTLSARAPSLMSDRTVQAWRDASPGSAPG